MDMTELGNSVNWRPIASDNVSLCDSAPTHETTEDNVQMLFDMCRTEDGKISVKTFLDELLKFGIQASDPRLEYMMSMLNNLKPHSVSSVDQIKLDPQVFRTVVIENIVLINKALQQSFIIPAFDAFCEQIARIFEKCKLNTSGKPADYIPQLAAYGSEHWGAAICTVDGQRFSLGHANVPFTLQAVSQAITYGICLNDLGEEKVHEYQGREPSGRTFNDLVLDHQNKPHNPLVNSGAILSAALILTDVKPELGNDIAAKYDYVFQFLKNMSGGEFLSFNNTVFLSERRNSDRNCALSHFMAENKALPPGVDIKKVLDLYCQICSLEMTCESLSVVASTLANGGVCPTTSVCCLNSEAVSNVRSLMYSCGMYNYSGRFAFDVGVPAKSGISGVTMVVIPNVLGMVLWSPNLDNLKNSVRGTMFCREFLDTYSFHRFDNVGGLSDRKSDPTFQRKSTAGETVVQILLAAASGDRLSLQRAWLRDIDLNITDYDGRTPLHLAATEGHLPCVKFLLQVCKVYPEPEDRWQQTPFGEAMKFGHKRAANFIRKYIEEHPEQLLPSDFSESGDDDEDLPLSPVVEVIIDAEQKQSEFDQDLMHLSTNPKLKQSTSSIAGLSDYFGSSRLSGLLAPSQPSRTKSGRATPRLGQGQAPRSRRASIGSASAFLLQSAYCDSRTLSKTPSIRSPIATPGNRTPKTPCHSPDGSPTNHATPTHSSTFFEFNVEAPSDGESST